MKTSFQIKSTYETDFASLIEEKLKGPSESIASVEDPLIDYALRCIKGLFRGRFLYLNLTPEGEVFGGDPTENLTMYVENSNLSPAHAEIKFDYNTNKYYLVDLNSKTGTWIALGSENPLPITDILEVRIGEVVYRFTNTEIQNNISDWLERFKLEQLGKELEKNGINQLEQLVKMTEEQIESLGLTEFNKNSLQEAIKGLPIDYPEKAYLKNKIKLEVINSYQQGSFTNIDKQSDAYRDHVIGWQGAILGNKIANCDFETPVGSNQFELYIKFQYGQYWLIAPLLIQGVEIFYRLKKEEKHNLQPDNIIEMGELQFLVQRFNTGTYEDKGTRPTMEDAIVVIHDIGVSEVMTVSFYAVYDGHGGNECAVYVAQQLIRNLRNTILKGEPYDECTNFYRYIHDKLLEVE